MTTRGECKNCGAVLWGRFCSACGQKGDVQTLSLGRLVADAAGDFFDVDSRLWRSLGTLAFKPGRLTRRYLEGQRAKYTPPFRMYLATSLVFFLALSFTRSSDQTPPDVPTPPAVDAGIAAPLDDAGGAPAAEDAVEDAPAAVQEGRFGIERGDDGDWSCRLDRDLDPRMRERLEAACRKIEADSGASFARAFVDNVPLMMLVFIPIVAAVMKVLYLFSRRKYVEHLLFFVHVHTFFFVTALLVLVLQRGRELAPWLEWPVRIIDIAAWSYFPVYLYLAMRHVYQQGYALTAVKYVGLGGSYFLALSFTLLGMVVYTAVTL